MIEYKFSNLAVAYAQMVIFDTDLDRPFNEWNSTHVDQGFSYRESSVSFALNDRVENINVYVDSKFYTVDSAYIGIAVPFIVTGSSGISIGTLVNQYNIPMKRGSYVVQFYISRTDLIDVDDVRIAISPGNADPSILVNDGSINRTSDFLMKADPA